MAEKPYVLILAGVYDEEAEYIIPAKVWDEYCVPALDRLRDREDLAEDLAFDCSDISELEGLLKVKKITAEEKAIIERLFDFEEHVCKSIALPVDVYPNGGFLEFKYTDRESADIDELLSFISIDLNERGPENND